MGITRRVFNYIIGCFLVFRKKPQPKHCVTLKDEELAVETEPEFEILAYHKPDREILYNILKSGTQSRAQIRNRILSRAKVVYRR